MGVTGYQVERCQGAGCTAFARIATPTTTSYGDTGLAPGTSYSYRVRAQDAAGNFSAYSPITTATPAAVPGDNFNRANALDLGSSWDAGYTDQWGANTNLQIVGNRVRATTASRDATETYTGVALSNNQWAQVTLATATGTRVMAPRLLLRFSAPGVKSGYEFSLGRGGSASRRALDDGMPACLRHWRQKMPRRGWRAMCFAPRPRGRRCASIATMVSCWSRRTPPSQVDGRGSPSMPLRLPMSNWMTLAQGVSKLDAYDIVERPANLRSQVLDWDRIV